MHVTSYILTILHFSRDTLKGTKMTKSDKKQIDNAVYFFNGNKEYFAATLACIHRASSRKNQKEIEAIIDNMNAWHLFTHVYQGFNAGAVLVASHQA